MGLTMEKPANCGSATDSMTLNKGSLFKWVIPFIFTDLYTSFCLRKQGKWLVKSPHGHGKQVPENSKSCIAS